MVIPGVISQVKMRSLWGRVGPKSNMTAYLRARTWMKIFKERIYAENRVKN